MRFYTQALALVACVAILAGCGPRSTQSLLLAGRSSGQGSVDAPSVDGQGGTTGGNPTAVGMGFGGYNPQAHPEIKRLALCVDRMRFVSAVGSIATITLNNVGMVEISPLGTPITQVNLPMGVFKTVEFDLKNECGNGHSVELTNDLGSFATSDDVTLQFDGSAYNDGATKTFVLVLNPLLDVLAGVSSGDQLKNAVETTSCGLRASKH
jgi:hypothetical protein